MFSAFPIVVQNVKAQETTLFSDDFESYTVGTKPIPPWELWFNQNGAIVNTAYVSPSKSFWLLGANGWAGVLARPIATAADTIGYEVTVRVGNWGIPTKNGANVGFVYKRSGSLWTGWAMVVFDSDGTIRSAGKILMNFNLDTWYKIRTVFCKTTRMYAVWINDVFKATIYENNAQNLLLIQALGLASNHAEQNCYFDNARFFTYDQELLTLQVEPGPAHRGNTVTFSGTLFNPSLATSVYLFYSVQGSGTWSLAAIMITDVNGNYSWSATVPQTTPLTTVHFMAYWRGSPVYRPVLSNLGVPIGLTIIS